MQIKKKVCKKCNTPHYLWARGMCKPCSAKEPKSKSGLKEKVSKVIEPTGELVLFKTIWATRPHTCSVCNEPLKEFNHWFFSHILSKGAFPKFRLYEKNIMLKCKDCHHLWETQPNGKLIALNPKWEKVVELHDKLVAEYYSKPPI